MKVIQSGNYYDRNKWWVGRQFKCGSCNAVIELEINNDAIEKSDLRNDIYTYFVCPECNHQTNIDSFKE